jgi:hypothetical protein
MVGLLMNNKLESILKGMLIAKFKVCQHMPGGIPQQNHSHCTK